MKPFGIDENLAKEICKTIMFLEKENQKYKEVIKEINILCDDYTYNRSASGIEVVHKIRNILKEVKDK